MRRLAVRVGLVVALVAIPQVGQAWNPLRALGRLFGSPVGGFVEAALVPSIESAESSGHRLIADVDRRLENRINHVGSTLNDTLATADVIAKNRLGQVDQMAKLRLEQADALLAARITQVDISANALVSNAVGQVDEAARKRIAQAAREGRLVIRELDSSTKERLAQADSILEHRIHQVHAALGDSIADADTAMAARIDQVDEVLGRRLGNVDVIATKQALNLEGAVVKVAVLVAVLVFLVFLIREFYKDFDALQDQRLTAATKLFLRGLPKRLAVALACGCVLLGAYFVLPLGPKRRAAELVALHTRAFETSKAVLDFSRVRYHASQLAILDPDREHEFRAEALKLELIRDVLSRPGLLLRVDGIRNLMVQVAQVERALGEADPDVLTIKGFISWQVAVDRHGELEAALACARALALSNDFLLEPLALSYLRAYLYNPPPNRPVELTAPAPERELQFGPMQHALDYNSVIRTHDGVTSTALVAMLSAHARLRVALTALRGNEAVPSLDAPAETLSERQRAVLLAKQDRRAQARALIAAWTKLDEELTSNANLASTSAVFAAFTLNDAPLSQALYLEARPDALDLPPAIREVRDPVMRLVMAPARIAWTRRYISVLGQRSQEIVQYEEASRFAAFERKTVAFARAYVDYEEARLSQSEVPLELRLAAARAAASLGLYVGDEGNRAPLGLALLGGAGDDNTRAQVESSYLQRHLRFL